MEYSQLSLIAPPPPHSPSSVPKLKCVQSTIHPYSLFPVQHLTDESRERDVRNTIMFVFSADKTESSCRLHCKTFHCKKRSAIFPGIIKIIPGQGELVWLVTYIPAGDGKIANLFSQCS
jgi:hypothetical protein